MTLKEAQALILLFQACRDTELRARVLRLVPELKSWDEVKFPPGEIIDFPFDVAVHSAGDKVCRLYGPPKKP